MQETKQFHQFNKLIGSFLLVEMLLLIDMTKAGTCQLKTWLLWNATAYVYFAWYVATRLAGEMQ